MQKILIIRLSAIGDVVMASPLIGAFRRTFPDAGISWLVEDTSKPVLEANRDLEEIIVWRRKEWRRFLREWRFLRLAGEVYTLVRDLRKRRFDLVVDAQGLLKSGIWAFLSGSGERIGIGSKEGSRLLMTRTVERTGASDGISSQYRLLAEALNLEIGDFRMEMAIAQDAEEYADRISGSLAAPYVVFSPFTTRPQKHWIDGRWRKLADCLEIETGFPILLLGGPDDRAASERIFPCDGDRRVNLVGKTTVQQAGAIIKNAALLIGVDTGLTHMGIALDTPTIALFGATRPYLNTEGTSGTVLYHPMDCSPCRRSPTCKDLFPCMDAISVDEVIKTARGLLRSK